MANPRAEHDDVETGPRLRTLGADMAVPTRAPGLGTRGAIEGDVVVVIPAYNEENSVALVVEQVRRAGG